MHTGQIVAARAIKRLLTGNAGSKDSLLRVNFDTYFDAFHNMYINALHDRILIGR